MNPEEDKYFDRMESLRVKREVEFRRMLREVGQPRGLTESQFRLIFAYAYEQGHACGYSEVEAITRDIVELFVRVQVASA